MSAASPVPGSRGTRSGFLGPLWAHPAPKQPAVLGAEHERWARVFVFSSVAALGFLTWFPVPRADRIPDILTQLFPVMFESRERGVLGWEGSTHLPPGLESGGFGEALCDVLICRTAL